MGYCVQYFYYCRRYWIFRKKGYGDICQFIRDACRFTSMDIVPPPHTHKHYRSLYNACRPPSSQLAKYRFLYVPLTNYIGSFIVFSPKIKVKYWFYTQFNHTSRWFPVNVVSFIRVQTCNCFSIDLHYSF